MPGGEPDGFVGIHDLRRLLGHYRWLEERLFEVLGAWVPTIPEPEVKAVVAEHSHRHAWHAEVWAERAPYLWDAPGDAAAPARPGLGAVLDAVAAPEGTIERLAGVYRVVSPHLVTAYRRHLGRASPVRDAPVARWLRIVLDDEIGAWLDGTRLLLGLLTGPQEAERAAAHQARVEGVLLTAGGLGGPDPPPTGD